jgi:arginase family enzyme
MQIDIIGVPIDLGADRRGVDMGPSAIRYAHLKQELEKLGYEVEDKGNVEAPIAEMCAITDPKLKYIDCIVPMSRRVAGTVATSVQNGHLPVVLGGDHSLSLGSIRGAAKHKKIGVLWVDAHADFNTPEPLLLATSTACPWLHYVDWATSVLSNFGMKSHRSTILLGWRLSGCAILTKVKSGIWLRPGSWSLAWSRLIVSVW